MTPLQVVVLDVGSLLWRGWTLVVAHSREWLGCGLEGERMRLCRAHGHC